LGRFTFKKKKPPTTPAPGDGKCLEFAIPYGKYCYYVYSGEVGFSWPDSEHYCQAGRMELVSIHSRAEVEFIKSLNYSKNMNLWIGLTRDNNLKCINFFLKPPVDGRWNDNNCLEKKSFACRHPQCKHFSISLFRYFNATQM
uniref:C-type lectin domain-containing protein n=1 Tax=Oreochromis niloticus TaxID=8128 RepID=A0A669C8T6_ORENI